VSVDLDTIDTIEVLPEVERVPVFYNKELVFGSYQDRSKTLVGYLEDLRIHFIEDILTFEKVSITDKDYTYVLKRRNYYFNSFCMNIVRFIKGEIPFYMNLDTGYSIYNRKHEKSCSLLPYVSGILISSVISTDTKIVNVSSNKYLFWQPKYVLGLYFNNDIIMFCRRFGTIPSESLILVDDIILENFQLTNDIINHLESIDTFQDVVKYLKQQLIFCAL
jgi:hypothetical protein